MGIFDNSQFMAPGGLQPPSGPSLSDFLAYKDSERRKNIQDQQDMMNFQSNLRFHELGRDIALQKANQPKPSSTPQNVIFRDEMTPYQAGQLALGREKVDATRDIAGAKNQVAQENAKTKEQLAAIHNLPDSEKYKMLLDGRITVENLKDAAAASRETEQGNIDIRKIDETGRLKTGQIEQQGNIDLRNIGARGTEARITKGTPSADAGVTANLPSQQVVNAKLIANRAIQDHPEWKNWISIDPNTQMVIVSPPATHMYDLTSPSAAEHASMIDYLRGKASPAKTEVGDTVPYTNVPTKTSSMTTGTTQTQPEATSTTTTTPAAGKKTKATARVMAPDGATGTWDYSNGPLPKGYKIVQ
jgi:hypothetical protein